LHATFGVRETHPKNFSFPGRGLLTVPIAVFRDPLQIRSGTDGDISSDCFAQQADAGSQS
jgi:hypothetical protein